MNCKFLSSVNSCGIFHVNIMLVNLFCKTLVDEVSALTLLTSFSTGQMDSLRWYDSNLYYYVFSLFLFKIENINMN